MDLHRSAAGFAVLLLLACSHPAPIARREGPLQRSGALDMQKIVFATTDHIVPRRIRAELGTLRVPENRSNPTGRETVIRFVRFRSLARSPGPPIIYLAGGPGGSGILSASGDRFPLFMRLREVADVIALDQRGVAERAPCPGSWSYPLDQPFRFEIMQRQAAPFLSRCVEHWGDRIDLSAYNTRESAEDLESLRVALGAEKVSLWGISYGTHLALAYLRQHPDRVHRAVLAGVEGPDHTYKLPGNIDAVLEELERHVQRDPKARALLPDLRGSLRRTLERLERDPATVLVESRSGERLNVTVGANDLRAAVYNNLGEREDIVELPARLAAIFAGDYRPLGTWALRVRRGGSATVMSIAMDCASGVGRDRARRIEAQSRRSLIGAVANLRLRAVCSSWPAFDLGEEFRAPVESDVEILAISGTLDARTPPSNAEEILRGFPNGRHLILDGGSHDDDLFLSSPAIAEEMVSFLRDGVTSRRRVVLPPLRF